MSDTDIQNDINNYENNDNNSNDTDNLEYELKEDDLVFNDKEDDGEVEGSEEMEKYGGGFSLKKAIMKAGLSPLQLVGGNAFGEPTETHETPYALPNWAYTKGAGKPSSNKMSYQTETLEDDDEYVSDDLHDRLLGLVTVSSSKDIEENDKNQSYKNMNKTSKKRNIKKTKKLRRVSTPLVTKKSVVRMTKKKRSVK